MNNMKRGIYLGAGKAQHDYNIVYQDIDGKRDIDGDMMSIDLSDYDYIIATPPCNFWSKARGKRLSEYSMKTKHLLPDIIAKCVESGKPFIVENVTNKKRMTEEGVLPRNDCKTFVIGRHIYFTNIDLPDDIEQRQDFKHGGYVIVYPDMPTQYRQGGFNVHNVIEYFLKEVNK